MGTTKTLADYHALAKRRGFDWIGQALPRNVQTKTNWQCEQGHSWQASYNNIHLGTGCPECVGVKPKEVADYCGLARLRGFKWIGTIPKNVRTKTSWQCKQGHRWQACYNNIQQGTGCPECCGKKPKEAADYHKLARVRGFTWTGGALPKNVHAKTSWQCGQGHSWQANYSNIQQGRGCSECSGKRPKETANCDALAESRGFEWTSDVPKDISNHQTVVWG
jgi:hypothetical protein